jgi:hypothetical protein
LIDKKTEGQKYCDTVPLKATNFAVKIGELCRLFRFTPHTFQHKNVFEKFDFRCVNDTAEANSLVSMRLQKQILGFH